MGRRSIETLEVYVKNLGEFPKQLLRTGSECSSSSNTSGSLGPSGNSLRSHLGWSSGLDQHLSRNPQFAVQLTDHIQRKRPGASHDFIDPSSLPNDPYQRPIILALLLQPKFN